jgi:hypothetical protein
VHCSQVEKLAETPQQGAIKVIAVASAVMIAKLPTHSPAGLFQVGQTPATPKGKPSFMAMASRMRISRLGASFAPRHRRQSERRILPPFFPLKAPVQVAADYDECPGRCRVVA